jgi:hypothetical protein
MSRWSSGLGCLILSQEDIGSNPIRDAMYILTEQLEKEILFNIWTTRDFLKFALEEEAISGYWIGFLADHQRDSEKLLDWLLDIRYKDNVPTHNDLAEPQDEVFI